MASNLPHVAPMRPLISNPISLGSSSASSADLSMPHPMHLNIRSIEVTKYGAITGLPLPPCPMCGDEIIELRCGPSSQTPGEVFFKCRLHEKDDPTTCPFYKYAKQYQKWLLTKGYIGNAVSKKDAGSAKYSPVDDDVMVALLSLRSQLEQVENGVQLVKKDLEALKAGSDQFDLKLGTLMDIGKLGVGCHVVVVIFVIVVLLAMLLK